MIDAASIAHVIFDRDGVLNRELDEGWLSDVSQWEWEEGVLEALARVGAASIPVSIVTNQSGVGRGVVPPEAVEAVHRWLTQQLLGLGIDRAKVFVCPHAPSDGCTCRKPLPGLVHDALAWSGVPAQHTVMIGDDVRDLHAGREAGVHVALVLTGKGREMRDRIDAATPVYANLGQALDAVL